MKYLLSVLDDWLAVLHRSITLVDLQVDAQNSGLFTYNTFIKILYMFRAVWCLSLGGLIVSMHHLISSLSAGDCPLHWLTGAQDSHLQTVKISDGA
jgi:hypothetical protein